MAFEQLKLSSQICFRLYSASRLVTQTYKPFLDKLGITYPQYLVLLETNTVTPLIQRMEKMGLVIRTKGIVDTRQRIVSLTKEGKAMEKEAAKVPACILEHFADCGLKKEEVFRLVPLLDEVINRLKDHTKDDFTTSKTKK